MKILVINAGSSSLKYKLFNMADESVMASGTVERVGEKVKDHETAMRMAVEELTNERTGVIENIEEIAAVGHRIVQGGEAFSSATRIDQAVKQAIRENIPLAPLHNPHNLTGIEMAERFFPGIENVAVFDTEFHQTLPPEAFFYGLPMEHYEKHRVRRYGFHGTSHKYVSARTAELMQKPLEKLNLISIHLGNGCSVSAVGKGKCLDTSMGMTPLAGLMMGTRTGDLDPAVPKYLMDQTGADMGAIHHILNKQSGLKGICGMSDMRDIHKARLRGDENAVLAVDMFCYRIKKYIGAYTAILGSLDGLVFTAGIGENDSFVREKVCENLDAFGICVDKGKNTDEDFMPRSVHKHGSMVQIWVVPTNEELQIARETRRVLCG